MAKGFFRKWGFLLAAAAFVLLGFCLRKVMAKPYVWLPSFAVWAVAFAFLTAHAKSQTGKYACIILASLFVALFAVEGYLTQYEPKAVFPATDIDTLRQEAHDPSLLAFGENRNRHDPVLGYSPQKRAVKVAARAEHNGELLYDIVYTTLENGWRITPQHPEATTAVVFFGCSFTIGEGLKDNESIPYRLGELLGQDYQVFNFGYHGYGAHHMLAMLENGYLDEIARNYEHILAFFPTIDGHELRCSGMSYWDNRGPWYALEKGVLVHKGNFTHNPVVKLPLGHKWFRNCLIFKNIFATKQYELQPLRELHAAIIQKSAAILRDKYHAPLTVALWPGAPFAGPLRERGVRYVDLTDIFPDYFEHRERYTIPHDGHPNPHAADETARLLARLILDRPAPQDAAFQMTPLTTPEEQVH